jgi:hypothetical protein
MAGAEDQAGSLLLKDVGHYSDSVLARTSCGSDKAVASPEDKLNKRLLDLVLGPASRSHPSDGLSPTCFCNCLDRQDRSHNLVGPAFEVGLWNPPLTEFLDDLLTPEYESFTFTHGPSPECQSVSKHLNRIAAHPLLPS